MPSARIQGFFGARGNLVRMQIMQAELVDQGFLHFFVHDEVARHVDPAAFVVHRARQMAIDVDGLAVRAVTGKVGNVVLAIELPDPAQDGIHRAVQHQAGNVPIRNS